MVKSEELMNFMLEKLGGEKAVQREFAKTQLIKSISAGATVGELIETAKEEDWLPLLLATKMSSLIGQAASEPAKTYSSRLTVEDKEKLLADILGYLKENPWKGSGDIAKGVDFAPTKVTVQLRGLKKSGLIKSSGNKASTRYALAEQLPKA